jgi:chromosome segregation ATPase
VHAEEIRALNEAHAKEIGELNDNWQAQVDALNEQIKKAENEHKAQIEAMQADMDALTKDYDSRIEKLNDQMKSKENELNSALDTANGKIEQGIMEWKSLKAEYDSLLDEKHMCDARIRALKIKLGVITPDATYTEKEHFDGLEIEFNAFNKFYKKCWNMAKKEIRKDMLNYKTLVGFDLHKKKL